MTTSIENSSVTEYFEIVKDRYDEKRTTMLKTKNIPHGERVNLLFL